MAQDAKRIDAAVEEALRRARQSRAMWSSSEAKLAISARSALRGLTSSSPVFSAFESVRGLLPFAAGMIDVLSVANPGEPASLVYKVPEEFLCARAHLINDDPAIPLATRLPVGLALRGTDVFPKGSFQQLPYIQSMYPRFGFANVTGMILSSTTRGGAMQSVVLWLFSGSGARLPTPRECRLLELVCGDLWEAMERIRLPLIPHEHLLFQLQEEQEIGYVVLRSDGALLEVNQRAVVLSEKYATRVGSSWRSCIDELMSTAGVGAQRRFPVKQRVQHAAGDDTLDLSAHRLTKESYAIGEDVFLIMLRETQGDPSAAAGGAGPLEKLTARQREVAALLLKSGHSQKQIADELRIAVGTVRKHSEEIHRKLGIHSRAELVALVRRNGHRRPAS